MEEFKKENYALEKLLVAVFFTALGYIFSITAISDVFNLIELLKTGLPELVNQILTSQFWSDFPLLPVIITWAVIGTSFYFLYFYLNVTYCDITNWLTVKTSFVNQKSSQSLNIKLFKRLLIHLLVALFSSIVIASIFVFFFPLAETMRETYNNVFKIYLNQTYVYITSYSLIFIYWYALINILGFILKNTSQIQTEEEISEQHIQIK